MAQFDVFNGDADGICALHQLRLAAPAPDAQLVTGVKRDISLLKRVEAAAGDTVTVCDISMEKNQADLRRLLAAGAAVTYFDHHVAGEIPDSAQLDAHIDTSAEVCTSLLVNRHLGGRYQGWAVAAAFGDNIIEPARAAAAELGLSAEQTAALEELGVCLNYNGYGTELADLFFHPAELYRKVQPYADPLSFMEDEPAFRVLRDGYRADMAQAAAVQPELAEEQVALYVFPDSDWARRVSGVYGNDLAQQHPARAHALLTRLADGYRVSVRAPLTTKSGAADLCSQFATGGGRKGAAGINLLPEADLPRFIDRFRAQFAGG